MNYTNFVVEFNECVENVKAIRREARHLGCGVGVINEVANFCNFLDDVNFKMKFVDNPEEYVCGKMLDAMDYLYDNFLTSGPLSEHKEQNGYKVINSIYDCVKEFYFNV